MKRKSKMNGNAFARFGIRPHRVRTSSDYRGGIRL